MPAEPSKPLSTWRIIWEALKLPTKNLKLLLPILLISLLTSSILYLANYYTTYRLLHDIFWSISPSPPSPPTNLELLIVELTILESIFFIISFILGTFLLIITITATFITHLTAQATLRDIFTRVKTSWKGPFITQLIVSCFSFAFFAFIMMMYMLVVFFLIPIRSVALLLFGTGILFLVLVVYALTVMVWSFAIVVSVIEDGCYGLGAFSRVKVLIEGRRKQLLLIASLIGVAGGVMGGVFNVLFGSKEAGSSSLLGGLLMVVVMGVWNMVMVAAYTVFYYDCRRSRGEEIMVSMKEGILYTTVYDSGYGKGDDV